MILWNSIDDAKFFLLETKLENHLFIHLPLDKVLVSSYKNSNQR